jgi:hypothetical protein
MVPSIDKETIMSRESQTVPSPIEVQKFLGGLEYPARKREIIDKAEMQGADDDVMNVLEQLPEREYANPTDISREIGKLSL